MEYSLKSITLSGNDHITFDPDSITVIVGPNNSGKSRLLQEILKFIELGSSASKPHRKVLSQIILNIRGTEQDFLQHVKLNSENFLDERGASNYKGLNYQVNENTVLNRWSHIQSGTGGLEECGKIVCTYVSTIDRLTISNPPNSINRLKETSNHPIHILYLKDEIEKKISSYFRLAFDQDLILNRGAGSILPLHVGENPQMIDKEDRVSTIYLQKLLNLDLIQEQGDGIKSFVGCLLSTIIIPKFITLLDEPEAFLHPPQAKLLGSILVDEHSRNQLIISTHDSNLLMGILERGHKKLNIIRITRNENKNYAVKLNSEDIKKCWSDPILRFSKILDGLFHDEILICESDTDCRFYSAILNVLCENSDGVLMKKPDFFFTSSGGKGRISVIAKALKKIKLSLKVIVDFDILFDKGQFKNLYESLGGSWDFIQTLYEDVFVNLGKIEAPLKSNDIKNKIIEIINNSKDKFLSEDEIRKIKFQLKKPNGFEFAKKQGKFAFKNQIEIDTFNKLSAECKKIGLCIVPLGELESFDPTVEGHGVSWVSKVLEKNLLSDDLKDAREFISDILKLEIHSFS